MTSYIIWQSRLFSKQRSTHDLHCRWNVISLFCIFQSNCHMLTFVVASFINLSWVSLTSNAMPNLKLKKNLNNFTYTENPEWIFWLIWAIVCHYTDKKTNFSHIFESFCPCTDPPLRLKCVKWFTRVFLCT